MDTSDLMRLLNADHYSPADLEEVSGICRNYPMFGLAHMLRVRIRGVLGQEKERDLKLAAVYSSDRKRLFEFIHEMKATPPADRDTDQENGREVPRIRFLEDSHQDADVIIEQHAPYVAPAKEGDLLELESEGEEPEQEEEEKDGNEELSSENLVGMVVKADTDMEGPPPGSSEVPVIDMIDKPSRWEENKRLIVNFITEEPGPIRAGNPTDLKGDVSQNSVMENDGLITDTLAKIYVKQGLYAKAIYAYERLSMKYPEKSAYFAAQIDKIKNINHS